MNTSTNPTTITATPGLPFLEITREFEAPAELVFRAHVEPELVVRWLGPRDLTMTVQEWDVRTGGGYRYTHARADMVAGFRGVYHSVDAPSLIVQTFEYDGAPGEVALEFGRYEDLPGGRSRFSGRTVFPSLASRDAAVASGMEFGVRESMERLDELLAG